MFRNLTIYCFVIIFLAACKGEKKSDDGEKQISPSVVDNPTTASSQPNSKDNVPVLKFQSDRHDFGKIIEGEKISFAFSFVNVGKGDLVIRAAQGSCGCTVPEFPKDPVKPGNGGIINVTFDSSGKEGHQEKTISVISNTMPNTYTLTISGIVEKANK